MTQFAKRFFLFTVIALCLSFVAFELAVVVSLFNSGPEIPWDFSGSALPIMLINAAIGLTSLVVLTVARNPLKWLLLPPCLHFTAAGLVPMYFYLMGG